MLGGGWSGSQGEGRPEVGLLRVRGSGMHARRRRHVAAAYTFLFPPVCPRVCREWEGIYVLYSYLARRQTARAVQQLLSNPEAGAEDTVLRHITLCKQ